LRAIELTIANATELRASSQGAAEAKAADFERLIRPHFARMCRLAFQFTRSAPDAEDLVQDVLVSLYQRCEELAQITDLQPWLAKVIYHRFVDQQRSFSRRRLTAPFRPPAPGDLESILDLIPSDEPGPEERAALASQLSQLGDALGQLNHEQRAVVLLHDAEGYSLEEIEQMTGTPVGTVKSRLHRGRAKLRILLGQGTFFV
jgi:RNA polymerase sigma-70 factor (ECF subfamily)